MDGTGTPPSTSTPKRPSPYSDALAKNKAPVIAPQLSREVGANQDPTKTTASSSNPKSLHPHWRTKFKYQYSVTETTSKTFLSMTQNELGSKSRQLLRMLHPADISMDQTKKTPVSVL